MELRVKCIWGKHICKWTKKRKYCEVFDVQEIIYFFVMFKRFY